MIFYQFNLWWFFFQREATTNLIAAINWRIAATNAAQ
jgi:hypothetical protein